MEVKKQTEMILAWELHEQGASQVVIARHLGRNREPIRLWLRAIAAQGLKGFLASSAVA